MKIWVDADACPIVVREILYRAASRTGAEITLIANHFIRTPPIPSITMIQVSSGFDIADNEIVQRCNAGDLVITSDIPLADEVITKGALALTPRGDKFTKENIKAKLNMRDFMETMRSSGVQSGGQAAFSKIDNQNFANALDQWLAKNKI